MSDIIYNMEKRIRAYEKYIKQATNKKLNENERARLARYHFEMLENFQHERIIHLIVMLFFVFITIVFLFVTTIVAVTCDLQFAAIPLYILTLILVILTGCYIKHYYFLENHIQNLYDHTAKLWKID